MTLAWFAAQRDHPEHPSRILLLNPEENTRHIYPLLFRDRVIAEASELQDLQSLGRILHAHCDAITGTIGEFYAKPSKPCLEPFDHHESEPRVFSGRDREIWDIHESLQAKVRPETQPLVILSGPQGQGKTLLALEYAYRFAPAYPGGIFRISAREAESCARLSDLDYSPSLKSQLLALERQLSPETSLKEGDSLKLIRKALGTSLNQKEQPFLWIVDDLPEGLNGPVLMQWLPPEPPEFPPQGHTILITNSQRYDARGDPIHLPFLNQSAALSAMIREKLPSRSDEMDALNWLAEEVGRHPLFAGFMRGVIEASPGDPRTGFIKRAQRIGRKTRQGIELATLWPKEFPEGRERSGANLLIETLQELEGPARDILRLAGEIAPHPIPLALIRESLLIAGLGADDRKEDLFTIFLNEPEEIPLTAEEVDSYVLKGVHQLQELGLGYKLSQSIELAPLAVHAFQKIVPSSPRKAILAEAALQMFYKLSEDCHAKGTWDRLSAAAPHVRKLLSNLRDHPIGPDNSPAEITGKIRLALHLADLDLLLGGNQRALCAYRNTSAYLVRAMAQDPHNSTRQKDFARVQEQLGDLLEKSDTPQDALDHYRKSLGIRTFMAKQEAAPPETIQETLRLNKKIAKIQRSLGDAEAALQTQQAAHNLIALQIEAAPNTPELEFDLASSHTQQGELHIRLKQPEESLREFRKALPIFEKLAEETPDSIRFRRAPTPIRNRIGDILHARDDLTGALEQYRTALNHAELLAREFPENAEMQRDLAQCHDNIGDTLVGLDDQYEANEQYKRFLEIAESPSNRKAFLGLHAREVASVHMKLGRIRENDKLPRLAHERYTRALTIIERLVVDHPENQRLRESFQWLRHKTSRLAERIAADDRRLARNQAKNADTSAEDSASDCQNGE